MHACTPESSSPFPSLAKHAVRERCGLRGVPGASATVVPCATARQGCAGRPRCSWLQSWACTKEAGLVIGRALLIAESSLSRRLDSNVCPDCSPNLQSPAHSLTCGGLKIHASCFFLLQCRKSHHGDTGSAWSEFAVQMRCAWVSSSFLVIGSIRSGRKNAAADTS